MGIKKDIKRFFERRKNLKILNTQNILNPEAIDENKKTIVFMSNGPITFDKDSGSNRLMEIIFLFKKINYNCIIAVENTFENDVYASFFADNGCAVYVENNRFSNVFKFLKSLKKIDLVWFNGALCLKKYFSSVKEITHAKCIYDMVDIHFLRYKRAMELEPLRISLKKNYKNFKQIETVLAKKSDIVVAISEHEKKIMSEFIDENKIVTISNIHYPKINLQERQNFESSKNIMFIGSIHEPNIDAVDFLYTRIMPEVWKKIPDVKVEIIGNVVEKLDAGKYPRFNFLGYVESVEELLKSSRIMVAPLRFGAGVKGKIGQAFEYFLPVVTTNIGAEGMKLINKENALIEDDAKEFANAIVDLYTDKMLWEKLQKNSEKSLELFSKEHVVEVIKNF